MKNLKFSLIIFILTVFAPIDSLLAATFERDNASQLLSVSYSGNKQITYTYDAAGNIIGIAVANGDSDADGLADSWETQYFGNLSRDGTGDFDNDGMTDAMEYRAGTDPKDAQSYFRLITISGTSTNSIYLEWLSSTNKFYTLERSSNLHSNFMSVAIGVGGTPPTNSFNDVSATNSFTYFYRLRLE